VKIASVLSEHLKGHKNMDVLLRSLGSKDEKVSLFYRTFTNNLKILPNPKGISRSIIAGTSA
jgi:hypothetical protein